LSSKDTQIIFIGNKAGILGVILRVFLSLFALGIVFFIIVGIYFLKGHRDLPHFIAVRTEILREKNKFLVESIERIAPNVGKIFSDGVKKDYSETLYSAYRGSKDGERSFIDTFSMAQLLDYSSSTLKQIESMAKTVSVPNSIFKNYPIVFPFPQSAGVIITRPFSDKGDLFDPFTGTEKNHNGVDLAAEQETQILAPADGEVTAVRDDVYWGKTVRVKHCCKYETFYAHLGSVSVRVGQKLSRGTQIGTIGESGWTTHPHLHYELIKDGVNVDPLLYNFTFLYDY
jgi:murein DD-endopeptidase MepM/ murein hydrolase activator NlpD